RETACGRDQGPAEAWRQLRRQAEPEVEGSGVVGRDQPGDRVQRGPKLPREGQEALACGGELRAGRRPLREGLWAEALQGGEPAAYRGLAYAQELGRGALAAGLGQ